MPFYHEMQSEWDLGSSSKIIVSLGDFNGHVGNVLRVLKMYMRAKALVKEMDKKEHCWSSGMKKNCVWQTFDFIKQTKRKSLTVLVDVKQ